MIRRIGRGGEEVDWPAIERLVEASGTGRFVSDAPFHSRPREAHLLRTLGESLSRDDASVLTAEADGGLVGVAVLRAPQWDRDHFGYSLGRIEHLLAENREAAVGLAVAVDAEAEARGMRMCSARVGTEDLHVINALEARGFAFRETTLSPWLDLRESDDELSTGVHTRGAEAADIDPLAHVARTAFRTDRFHLDDRFETHTADDLYERWLRSWLTAMRPEHRARVLIHNGVPAGFILYEIVAAPYFVNGAVASIVLAAVDPAVQGSGLGIGLWRSTLRCMREEASFVTTVMTARNSAVFNLYVRLGFRFTSSEVTLHRWYD